MFFLKKSNAIYSASTLTSFLKKRNDHLYGFLAHLHNGWSNITGHTLVILPPSTASKNTSEQWGTWRCYCSHSWRVAKIILQSSGSLCGEVIQHSYRPCKENTLWFAPYLCHVDTHPWPVVSKFIPLLLLHGSCRIWNIANQVLFRDNFKVPRLLFSIENYVFRNWPKDIIGM